MPAETDALAALRLRLAELGYVEGRNLRLDLHSADGVIERLPALAEEIARQSDIDAIFANTTPAALAARRATTRIPIIAIPGIDPVKAGLTTNLAHPDGNVTGVTIFADETNAKALEIIRETFPSVSRIAAIAGGTTVQSPGALRSVEEAGHKLGFTLEFVAVEKPATLADRLSPAALAPFDAFLVMQDAVLAAKADELVALLGATRRPAIYPTVAYVRRGGLMSFGPDLAEAVQHAAIQLTRVLDGARPGEIPFERSTKFALVVNLKTARALGLELPQTLIFRADEVID